MPHDQERLQRFEDEARAAAALNHPNIVTIYAVEEAEGIRFFTTELVRGRLLSAVIPEGGLPIDRILEYAIPMADAMSAVSRTGISNRPTSW